MFKNQTAKPITLNMYVDLTAATLKQILWRKPSGENGFWTATTVGLFLSYLPIDGDLNEVGDWLFQGYYEQGLKKGYGEIQKKTVTQPIYDRSAVSTLTNLQMIVLKSIIQAFDDTTVVDSTPLTTAQLIIVRELIAVWNVGAVGTGSSLTSAEIIIIINNIIPSYTS